MPKLKKKWSKNKILVNSSLVQASAKYLYENEKNIINKKAHLCT